MEVMKLNEFKLLFPTGVLTKAVVREMPLFDGWVLLVYDTSKDAYIQSERRRGQQAVYKTVKAGVEAARQIGFNTVKVELVTPKRQTK